MKAPIQAVMTVVIAAAILAGAAARAVATPTAVPSEVAPRAGAERSVTAVGYRPGYGEPAGTRLSLVRYGDTVPLRVLQVTTYFGDIDTWTAKDTTDAHFIKREGLSNRDCVSFESVKHPGRFLRAHGPDTRIELSGGGIFDFSFTADATFCPRSAAATPSENKVLEFESVNHPGFFLRKTGDHLTLSQWDSSQPYEIGLVEREPVSLGTASAFTYTINGQTIQTSNGPVWIGPGTGSLERWGACTGLTPFWSRPKVTSVSIRLSTGRVVSSTATSTPAVGFYPRVTLYGNEQFLDQVYSVDSFVMPCLW